MTITENINDSERTLARLTVAICLGDWKALREVRGTSATQPDRGFREAILQAHLFAGFPRVIEACEILEEAGGLGQTEADEASYEGDKFWAGSRLFETVYADQAEEVRGRLNRHHPILARWIEGHAYGRVLARKGLPVDFRELLAVCSLAALGQDRQLASHVRGAVRFGATRQKIEAALSAVKDLITKTNLKRAQEVVAEYA